MIDAGQSIFAAVGLGIAIAGLLLLAPSRRLALGASAFAIVAGLGAALVFAARAVPPMPAAQATVAVQPSPLPTATTSPAQESAGDMAQREQDLIKPWSEKLDAQERQHKVKIDVLRQVE